MESYDFEQPTRQSWLGISSFSLSILMGLGLFVLIILAGMMEADSSGGIDEESPEAILLGLLMFACLFGELIAGGLGIAGLFERNKVKVFSILGLVFAVAVSLMVVGLMVIGFTMG